MRGAGRQFQVQPLLVVGFDQSAGEGALRARHDAADQPQRGGNAAVGAPQPQIELAALLPAPPDRRPRLGARLRLHRQSLDEFADRLMGAKTQQAARAGRQACLAIGVHRPCAAARGRLGRGLGRRFTGCGALGRARDSIPRF